MQASKKPAVAVTKQANNGEVYDGMIEQFRATGLIDQTINPTGDILTNSLQMTAAQIKIASTRNNIECIEMARAALQFHADILKAVRKLDKTMEWICK